MRLLRTDRKPKAGAANRILRGISRADVEMEMSKGREKGIITMSHGPPSGSMTN